MRFGAHLAGAAALCGSLLLGGPVRATGLTQPPKPVWSGNHALVIPAKRVELGLFGSSHYGWLDHFQFSLHPLWFFALPHVEVKGEAGWLGEHALSALRLRLSYPTLFLKLVSREGAGGLLPATSKPPQALQVEVDYLLTAFASPLGRGYGHMATVLGGFAVAPHGSFTPSELPLLDFPFAYPRLAAIYTHVVPRFAFNFEGPLVDRLHYEASVTYYAMPGLPDVTNAFALEPAAQLEYRFDDRVAVSLGLRASVAEYPYGTLVHALPFADVRVGW